MKLGSLFDGSGGFPLAGAINGITPVWASEIEPYPIRVTKARFPNMRHLGSVLDVRGDAIEPVDVITFGSPCQDLSVAGKQKGIHDGERSSLFFEAVRIVKEMRDHDRATGRSDVDVRPRYIVWENVPGAFSSNGGEDFRAVLEAIGGIAEDGVSIPRPAKGKWKHSGCVVSDGWSIAWRMYDAQYWGVPQRRKRIYLVADFASERAGEILFEREGVRGNPEESGEAREGIADDAQGGAGGSCGAWSVSAKQQSLAVTKEISATLGANDHKEPQVVCASFKGGQGPKAGSIGYQEGQAPTLTSANSGTNTVPDVVYPSVARTLTAEHDASPCVDRGQNMLCYAAGFSDALGENAQGGMGYTEEGSPALRAGDARAVVYDTTTIAEPTRKYIVRRLTPLECCRLQGFPDWWEEGVEGSDSARYKMWGNGIALPCAVDVLRRIAKEGKT